MRLPAKNGSAQYAHTKTKTFLMGFTQRVKLQKERISEFSLGEKNFLSYRREIFRIRSLITKIRETYAETQDLQKL
jgi:hypothetical protein